MEEQINQITAATTEKEKKNTSILNNPDTGNQKKYDVGNITKIIAKIIVSYFVFLVILTNVANFIMIWILTTLLLLESLIWAGNLFHHVPLLLSLVPIVSVISVALCFSIFFNLKKSKKQSFFNGIKFFLANALASTGLWVGIYEIEKFGALSNGLGADYKSDIFN